ncbi:MAG: hypothetical protein LBK82_05415 [Planctomycetaceae bacterium]|jgi:hypothetical protein|nr:hypothetical protein [Planctomycetaceae bacterium]
MLLKDAIKITSHSGNYSSDEASVSITFIVFTDDWRDGPLAIVAQGIASEIVDESGKVKGWLQRGKPYRFGNEIDERIVASDVEVSDRKVIGTDNEYDISIRSNDIKLQHNDHRQALVQWTVKQNFKKPDLDNQEESDKDDPEPSEDDNFTLKYGKEWIEVPFIRDVNFGNLVTNSAGDAFIPTPTMKKAIRMFTLSRKERVNRLKLYENYENVVNKDSWYGAKPGTVLMESITPSWDGNIFTVEYLFKYNEKGWGEKYLDTGFRELFVQEIDGKDGKKIKIKEYTPINATGSQTPVEEPAKLDGNGRVPIHRQRNEAKDYPFIDADGNIMRDSETFEELWYETGNPIYITDKNDKKYKKPYENFPGVDVPNDPLVKNPETGKWEQLPLEKQHFFWKYKAIDFKPLLLPNPYKIKLKPKPKVTN